VEQSLRGQGIGKAMVADVRVLARAFGCREVILGVHPENDTAVGFYQKCGFRIRTINMDMKI
jgi:ribosomal protein S18 acetylase RimI-like enzyme